MHVILKQDIIIRQWTATGVEVKKGLYVMSVPWAVEQRGGSVGGGAERGGCTTGPALTTFASSFAENTYSFTTFM